MTRLSLPVTDWPNPDRNIWLNACAGTAFGAAGRLVRKWSVRRRRIVEQGYGQWLAFLASTEPELMNDAPAARFRSGRFEAFVRQLQDRVASWSVQMMVQATQRMMIVLAPSDDWSWLNAVAANLKHLARPERDKRSHMVDPHDLYELGHYLLGESRALLDQHCYRAPTVGRDGLLLALLICVPVRIANLTQIEIGKHLIRTGGHFRLCFQPEDTKTARMVEGDLPPEMTEEVEYYLTELRPRLLARGRGEHSTSLWISRWGTPMAENSIRDAIKVRTADAFGRHVWPHLFRTIAATGFVDFAPDRTGLLPDLLGHSTVQTTHRYYVLSSAAKAHQAVTSAMLDRRAAAMARLKNKV